MSDISVQLVDHMGSDLSVVNAARVSMDKESEWDVVIVEWYHETDTRYVLTERDTKLIRYLANHNHWTPFAHPQVTLRIKAPIFLARQMFKHKVGLVENEVSRRYVDAEPEFYGPSRWRKRADNVKQGSGEALDHETDGDVYEMYMGTLSTTQYLYKEMLRKGVCPEQARMVLPQSMMTEWIWTGSLYAFSRICRLRMDPHAQREAQELASLISDVIQPLFPESWKVLVPH